MTLFETRFNERMDRADERIDSLETRFNERMDRTDEAIVKVREDVSEVKGMVDLMVAIATKSENERMAEAIIAMETRRVEAAAGVITDRSIHRYSQSKDACSFIGGK